MDTDATIRDRIAVHYNVDPRLVAKYSLTGDGPLDVRTIHHVYDAYLEWEKAKATAAVKTKTIAAEDNEPSFAKFFRFGYPKFASELTPTDFARVWKALWEGFDIPEMRTFYDTILMGDIATIEGADTSVRFDKSMLNIPFAMEASESLKKRVADFDANVGMLKTIVPVPTTHFMQTKQYISISVANPDAYPLVYLFDCMQLTSDVPFAMYAPYCKIHTGFTLHGTLPTRTDDSITLLYRRGMVADTVSTNDMWYKNYNPVTVRLTGETVVVELGIESNANQLAIVSTLEHVFHWPYSLQKEHATTNKISGRFFVPRANVDPTILKDILMFQPVFRDTMYVNDIATTPSSGADSGVRYTITVHYTEPKSGHAFVCSINTREVSKSDIVSPVNINGDLKIGEPLTVCKIRHAVSVEMATRFQQLVGKLLAVYAQHEKAITSFYSTYLKDVNSRVFTAQENTLSTLAPDLFIDLYTVACPKPRNPIVVDSSDYDPEDPTVMKFPKNNPNALVYKCPTPAYPYVGLKENALENKDEYPYLPCCYKLAQTTNAKSNYSKYFTGDTHEATATGTAGAILKTQKFASAGVLGVLPPNIHALLHAFTPAGAHATAEYYREGMHYEGSGRYSTLLECVLRAVQPENTDLAAQRKAVASTVRNSGVCKQECYDLTPSEIADAIADPSVYLDPQLHIRALEEHYNVNIIYFLRSSDGGDYGLPRHVESKGYLFPPYKPRRTVMVYEHTGGIYTKYRSCELIVTKPSDRDGDNATTVAVADEPMARKLYKQWVHTFPVYEGNNRILPLAPPDIHHIVGQHVDPYGKTRGLQYGNTDTYIHCMPMAPLHVPLVDDSAQRNTTSFAARYGLDGSGKTGTGFRFEMDRDSTTFNTPTTDPTRLSSFVYSKRLSAHLIEYALYLLSVFMHNEIGSSPSASNTAALVSRFMKQYTTVRPSMSVMTINYITGSNPVPLPLESVEVARKLEYMLRVHLLNRRKEIEAYHKLNHLENYYNTIYDFAMHPDQYVYPCELVSTRESHKNVMYTVPPATMPKHLFYMRYAGQVYLAQPCASMDEAMSRVRNWTTRRQNVSTTTDADRESPPNVTCIPYINYEYVTPVRLGDVSTNLIIYSSQADHDYYIVLYDMYT